ncbi:hypothetical protein E2C01_075753 [Portunus trituberculatus]|uniref:Uncharacterized protein n=1 Tax=Portunus trituberculatus TaxID=210409 RepID=A0A5B7IH43_PORTR|nr:hypothetical protein [Portunus trituberculatus]
MGKTGWVTSRRPRLAVVWCPFTLTSVLFHLSLLPAEFLKPPQALLVSHDPPASPGKLAEHTGALRILALMVDDWHLQVVVSAGATTWLSPRLLLGSVCFIFGSCNTEWRIKWLQHPSQKEAPTIRTSLENKTKPGAE